MPSGLHGAMKRQEPILDVDPEINPDRGARRNIHPTLLVGE